MTNWLRSTTPNVYLVCVEIFHLIPPLPSGLLPILYLLASYVTVPDSPLAFSAQTPRISPLVPFLTWILSHKLLRLCSLETHREEKVISFSERPTSGFTCFQGIVKTTSALFALRCLTSPTLFGFVCIQREAWLLVCSDATFVAG